MACVRVEQDSHLLFLPGELLEKILSCLSFEDISYTRQVCHKLDNLCQSLLNNGYSKVDKFHGECQRKVRSQLPRRESERRNHPLARHVDILAAIETRLSLLGMTFMKYVDMGLCCFIPGKVLDEIFRVLHFIQNTKAPPRAHELLQELRDISSMAMEHFDEKIVPVLKKKIPPVSLGTCGMNSTFPGSSLDVAPGPSPLPLPETLPPRHSVVQLRNSAMKQELLQLKHSQRSTNSCVNIVRKEVSECKVKLGEIGKKNLDFDKKFLEQSHIIAEQSRKLAEQEKTISDLNRKLLEYDQKFVDLMDEFSRSKSSTDILDNRGLKLLVSDNRDANGNPFVQDSMDHNDSGVNVDDKVIGPVDVPASKRNASRDNRGPCTRKRRALRDESEASTSKMSHKKYRA